MNLLTFALIEDLKYSVNPQELTRHSVEVRSHYELRRISDHDYYMLNALYSVRVAELYAKDLKKRFTENYNIYY